MSDLSSQLPEIKAEKLSQSPRSAGSAWAREKRFADETVRRRVEAAIRKRLLSLTQP